MSIFRSNRMFSIKIRDLGDHPYNILSGIRKCAKQCSSKLHIDLEETSRTMKERMKQTEGVRELFRNLVINLVGPAYMVIVATDKMQRVNGGLHSGKVIIWFTRRYSASLADLCLEMIATHLSDHHHHVDHVDELNLPLSLKKTIKETMMSLYIQ